MTRLQKALDAACESPPATVADGRLVLERLAAESRAAGHGARDGDRPRGERAGPRRSRDQCQDVLDDLACAGPVDVAARPSATPQAHLPGFTVDPDARRTGGARRRMGRPGAGRGSRRSTASRAQAIDLAEMEWGFLFDRTRHLLSIGYNVAERRRDSSYYDLLASEARLCTFVAIAQGHLPQESWFALGRLLTTAAGEPVLLSWSGSMFEYLMPLVVMPGYDDTLLDQTCKAAVRRQIEYGRHRGVPWGISESGYNLLDARLTYQYRAFGVPGLGLKRGLADDLVVAPYASALALMVSPEEACANLQRLAAEGFAGEFGFYEAIDYTPSRLPRGQSHAVVRSYMAHHQGMTFLSLAQVLLDGRMQARFASDPAFQATALLLQERIPRASALYLPPPPRRTPARRRPDADDRGALVQRARHARARGAAAVERPVSRRGHQRGRRVQPMEGPRRHPLARGRDVATTGAPSATSGTSRPAPSGPRRTSRRCSRPTGSRRCSPRPAPSSAAGRTRSRATPRSPCRPRTMSSCAGCA